MPGSPTPGKSSLLNRLVGDDVAIVTDVPGTTRDLLRHPVQLDGLPLHLVDTAGLRTAGDVVEEEGIRRAQAAIRHADRVLYVVDAGEAEAPGIAEGAGCCRMLAGIAQAPGISESWAAPRGLATELAALPPGVPVTLVVNKIDLIGVAARLDETDLIPRVFLSARHGDGMDLLRAHLKSIAGYHEVESGALSARRRHLDALNRANDLVQSAADVLADSRAVELFAEETAARAARARRDHGRVHQRGFAG